VEAMQDRVKFPRRQEDGTALAELWIAAPDTSFGTPSEELARQLSAALSLCGPYSLSGLSFDPVQDLVSPPQVRLESKALVLRLHLRDFRKKFWRDWLVHQVVPAIRSVVPGATIRQIAHSGS
jgi:hypothetical protein